MSANYGNSDSSYRAEPLPSFSSRTIGSSPGMELSPSQFHSAQRLIETQPESSSMSTLTMERPPPLPSPNVRLWDERRTLELPSRPRSPNEKVELPSIRQAIPEIQMRSVRAAEEYRSDPASSYPPTVGPAAVFAAPEYVQSPSVHKRRRLSSDDGQDIDLRERVVPRMYRSPSRPSQTSQSGAISPTTSTRRVNTLSTSDTWAESNRTSPYTAPRGLPLLDSSSITRADWRPTLPSLPALSVNSSTALPRGRSSFSEYALESSRSGAQTYPQLSASQFEPPMSSYHPALSYGYQQPRGQSYSGPSSYSLSHDRSPFSSNHHTAYPGSSFPYGLERDENDSKQRKRRGNLPKETTDKLRAWFVAHLQHPYPTEDEKQELMRQTGLQMNQISNWFINARRRQLPAMINNARAESDARSARSGDMLHGEATSDYGDEKRSSVPLADSEGEGSYDGEYDIRDRRPLRSVGKGKAFDKCISSRYSENSGYFEGGDPLQCSEEIGCFNGGDLLVAAFGDAATGAWTIRASDVKHKG